MAFIITKTFPPATCLLLYLLRTILVLPSCSQTVPAQTCDPRWFGLNCQYRCRCGGKTCGQDGVCSDGVCWWGWFGPGCQFVDLVIKNRERATPKWIYDRDATTCNQDQSLKYLTVKMSPHIPFTWLRLQVNDPSLLHKFQVKFRKGENRNPVACRNARIATVNETTLDIHCDLHVLIQTVVLVGDGVKSLCSLYVSGGRNVALRQNTSQSSTYSNVRAGHTLDFSVSGNAVDGNINSVWTRSSCTSTNSGDIKPNWTVALSHAHIINRYVVYNRSNLQYRIERFTLTSFTNNLTTVVNYTDKSPFILNKYTIIDMQVSTPVSVVNIQANNKMINPILSICEVQLYGDSACPPSRYGRECEHTCNCAVKNESCFVSTGGCPSGCAAGFQGEGCDRVCDFGKYGLDCSSNCSQFCVATNSSSSPCLPTDGACVLGCVSGYQAPKCGHILVVVKGDNSIPVTAVVGPLVAVVVLVMMTAILWRGCRTKCRKQLSNAVRDDDKKYPIQHKHAKQKQVEPTSSYKRSEDSPSSSIDQVIMPKQTTQNIFMEDNSNSTVYNNSTFWVSSTSIKVRDMSRFIASRDTAFFQHQFNCIPANPNATMTVGMNEGNKHKNRYKNICAYDHSRVLLKTSSENKWPDYINASYIDGYRGKRKFIASQGPTKATLEDFVRMLSEQDVQVVVMLTNLTEKGKVKCERYWPEDDVIQAGDIKVKLTTTQVFADYTIRRLQLSRDGDCVHELIQFHFTAWPDKSVPTTAWSLVDFEHRVASISTDKPIVVHCSAGVGRTGTFIALCNVLVEATETGYMDFFTAVQKLRHDRANMVQTSVQYEFLYRAALVAVVCMGTTVMSSNFTSRIKELNNSTDSGESLLDHEFKATCGICHDWSGICDDGSGNCEDSATCGICDDGRGNCDDSATCGICDDDIGNCDVI